MKEMKAVTDERSTEAEVCEYWTVKRKETSVPQLEKSEELAIITARDSGVGNESAG